MVASSARPTYLIALHLALRQLIHYRLTAMELETASDHLKSTTDEDETTYLCVSFR